MTTIEIKHITRLVVNTSKMEDEIQEMTAIWFDVGSDHKGGYEEKINTKRKTQNLEMQTLFNLVGKEKGFALLDTYDAEGKRAMVDEITA